MYCKVAQVQDIPTLCILLQQLFSQEAEFVPDTEVQTHALKMIIENKNVGEIFIILKEEKIVGMVNFLYTISTALGTKVAILEDMILEKNYRGQNLGTTLIDFALAKVKENGCRRVTLLTDEDNTYAHKFYQNKGFEKSSMVPFKLIL